MTDMYTRPSRAEIAERVNAETLDDVFDEFRREQEKKKPAYTHGTDAEKQTSRNFVDHAKRELRAQGKTAKQLAAELGLEYHALMTAWRSGSVSLGRAASIAAALGRSLDSMLGEWECETCHGEPPAGFTCRSCGAES